MTSLLPCRKHCFRLYKVCMLENFIKCKYCCIKICIHYLYVHRYDVQWHIAPLHIQKIILFLLQRGAKDYTINVGGLFVGSLECFATVKIINILLKYTFIRYII